MAQDQSTDDLVNQYLQASTLTPQPSMFGVQAPNDPGQIHALLQKLQQQQFLDRYNQPSGGQYGYLHDAGKQNFTQAGKMLGNMLTQPGAIGGPPQAAPPAAPFSVAPPQSSPDGAAPSGAPNITPTPGANPSQTQSNAIKAAQAYHNALVQQGVPADQAQLQTLQKMESWGLPVSKQLSDAQEQVIKNQKVQAEAGKDTSQGNAAQDEIRARQVDEANRSRERDQGDTRLGIEQQNADTERMKANALQAAGQATPDGMKAMLDFYHTNGTVPPGALRNPTMAKNFWAAEGAYQASTGNTAAASTANKMEARALTVDTSNVQKQLGATQSYLTTMDKNIEKARALGNQLDFSDLTGFNKALAAWDKGTSDPTYVKYNAFFNSVATEYAKLSSGNMGNTTVSDSQRHETQEIVKNSIGNGGMNALFDALKEEGQNKVEGYQEHLQQNMQRVRQLGSPERQGLPQVAPPQAPAPAPPQNPQGPPPTVLTYDPKTGTFH